ncbi:MAG: SsrA-binding protein [candidate division WS2 bacterium ADurb.Bin280]|uniref:SsrA-binding protein n=1 Tax=candidate division WS2 bacterium ADurb.Bin280 TaxID=1852829 RepID=A0A1V5SCC8_9BACT|nr:MAG: SsrA-binding protein [candidate division WS2 bacterium ADurb.Bin280]
MQIISRNKIASREYDVSKKIEAGIVLTGEEIKSIRANRVNLKGSYVKILNRDKGAGEAFLIGCHIFTRIGDPYRTRKLLLKKAEIRMLIGKTTERGLTLIPLSLYIKKGRAKIEVAIAKGLHKVDKREKIKKQETDRRIRKLLTDKK